MTLPSVAVHYHRADRPAFSNLSDLSDDDLGPVIDCLMADHLAGRSKRVFGRRYMDLRRRTEAELRRLFIEIGGSPDRPAPHYFTLGPSEWFRGLCDDMVAVPIDLADLPADQTTFTYPDSFTAMGLAPEYGLPYEPKPYHRCVHRLDELEAVINRFGLPEPPVEAHEGYERRPFEAYIEIQLWADDPILSLQGTAGGRP